MEQKIQVDIAIKLIVDEHNNRTSIISTFSSMHLLSFMSEDQTVFKLSQDPDFVDRRTDNRIIVQTDTRMEG